MNLVPLSEVVATLESGARPKGGVSEDSGEIPSLGGEHLSDDGGFRLSSLKRVPREFYESMRSGHIQTEDILIVKDGATTGRTSFVPNGFPFSEAAVNEHVFLLRINHGRAIPKYIFHYLKSDSGQAGIQSDFRGATVGGISRDFINKVKIPLPPLPEQRRIAAILDQADALRAKRREALAELDQLTQSIFIEMFGDPCSNPKHWKICTLGQVSNKITDGTHKTPTYVDSGVEFLSAKDLKNERIEWGGGKFISNEEHKQLVKRCNPEIGDVLLAKSGSLGAVAIIDRQHEFSLFESLCLIKHDRSQISGYFLTRLLRVPSMLVHLLGKNKGVAIKHLHLVDVRNLKIPIPPISFQTEFEIRAKAVEKIKDDVNTALLQFDALFTSLQHRAFRGEL